jgi:putative spermidine/putrescine transport system substrate-binding protein
MINPRGFTKSLLMAGSLLAGLCVAGTAEARNLVVVDWGGAAGQAVEKAFDDAFTAATGIPVTRTSYTGGLAQVKAQVQSGNVAWDVVDADLDDGVNGCNQDILEHIPVSLLPKGADGSAPADDFLPGSLVSDCGIPNYLFSSVFAYNPKLFPHGGPKTIADFFNLKKFPGKRGLRRSPIDTLEIALMADGVPADKVYATLRTKEGVDRAFRKLDTIKSSVIWWKSGSQPPELLADGEVAMSTSFNGRFYDMIEKDKKPVTVIWDGQVWDSGAFIVPKGTPNKALAIKYLQFVMQSKVLASLTNYLPEAPARKSALQFVNPKMLPYLSTAPTNFHNALKKDDKFWGDYGDQLNQRFEAWLAK